MATDKSADNVRISDTRPDFVGWQNNVKLTAVIVDRQWRVMCCGLYSPWYGMGIVWYGLTSHLTHFRSFRRRWSDCGISQSALRVAPQLASSQVFLWQVTTNCRPTPTITTGCPPDWHNHNQTRVQTRVPGFGGRQTHKPQFEKYPRVCIPWWVNNNGRPHFSLYGHLLHRAPRYLADYGMPVSEVSGCQHLWTHAVHSLSPGTNSLEFWSSDHLRDLKTCLFARHWKH